MAFVLVIAACCTVISVSEYAAAKLKFDGGALAFHIAAISAFMLF